MFVPFVLLGVFVLIYRWGIQVFLKRMVASLDEAGYKANPEDIYVVSAPFSLRPKGIYVHDGVIIVSEYHEESFTHFEFTVEECERVNRYGTFMEFIPKESIGAIADFVTRLGGYSEFTTTFLRKYGSQKTRMFFDSRRLTEELCKDIEKAGFRVVSEKPKKHVVKKALKVIIVLLILFFAIMVLASVLAPTEY